MSSSQGASIQEYSIRVPKNVKKRYHVMRFNATLGVDFAKWSAVKMERENNMKEFRGIEEDTPKFGAGSEFGKEAREEARRKKLGIISRKYKPDDQPWILKAGGSLGKKFKGIREGGVSENASYYVFTHAPDGAIEAFPLNEWYKFQPIQRYKSLSAEEAEQEFGKRNRVLNYFSLMLRKRLKGDEEHVADGEEQEKGKKGGGKKSKVDLKISDMDEWMDSSEDESEESGAEEKNEEEKAEKKKKNKKADNKKKKPKRDTDLEAFEDSDDGDNEGRELDYISDSSESEPDEPSKNLQGVAEEKALRKLLTSDEDSEDEENKSEKEQSPEDEDDEKKEAKEEKEGDKKKNKKKQKKKDPKKKKGEKEKPGKEDSSSDFSSDSTDSESENKKDKAKKDKDEEKEKEKDSNSANSSRSASPLQGTSQNKRKLPTLTEPVSKKPKFDTSLSNYIPGSSESGITEDAVRRYLMRKPMTATELLQKFRSKKTSLSNEQLVNIMTQILKKINPVKQTIKGKMYLSIKA